MDSLHCTDRIDLTGVSLVVSCRLDSSFFCFCSWKFIALLFSQHKKTRQPDKNNERKRNAGDKTTLNIPKFFKVTLKRFKTGAWSPHLTKHQAKTIEIKNKTKKKLKKQSAEETKFYPM